MTPPSDVLPERRRLYVDTSAYLCMLLAEDGADRLSARFVTTDGSQEEAAKELRLPV